MAGAPIRVCSSPPTGTFTAPRWREDRKTMGRFTRYAREAMTMHRRSAMSNVRTAGYALVLFGSLVLCAASVLGQPQPCVPVVYAFRHAEDWNPTYAPYSALTPTGQAHAALYPTMVSDFQ